MAFDPLHKPKTFKDRRRKAQADCRALPCVKMMTNPPCVLCVNEGLLLSKITNK